MKYQHTVKAMCSMPWMIQIEKLEAFIELLTLRIEGGKLSPEEVADRTDHPHKDASRDTVTYAVEMGSNANHRSEKPTQVAVIPIYGVIMHRPSLNVSSGGGFSIQQFRSELRSAVANPRVSAIVMDVDSPGGAVDGVEEISKEIYDARKKKKIVAVANTLAASAAYYIASAAEEFVVTPSGEVGSIGVYMLHQDASGYFEKEGLKNTLIKAGKYKAEGNPWMGLDEEALSSLQHQVDGHYDMFVRAVARNRGVSVDVVRNGFGEGRCVMAKEAVKLGMADRVATLDEVLKSLGATGTKTSNVSGEAETPDVKAASNDVELCAARRQRELDMF